jgi:cytochrome c-type biogenesis protein CcmE
MATSNGSANTDISGAAGAKADAAVDPDGVSASESQVGLYDDDLDEQDRRGVALPPRKQVERRRSSWWTVGLLVAAAGGISVLVMMNFKDSTVYAKGVDQLLNEQPKWVGRNVRAEGTLVRGTLKFQEKPCLYEFDATKNGKTMHVKFPSCIKPDTLRDDMPGQSEVGVTAEGKLLASGEFEANNVLAKCPSKYEMQDKAKPPIAGQPGAKSPSM